MVEELSIRKGVATYEHVAGHRHHDHLLCIECNKVVELASERLEKVKKEESQVPGWTVVSHSLKVYGVCPDCFAAGYVKKTAARPHPRLRAAHEIPSAAQRQVRHRHSAPREALAGPSPYAWARRARRSSSITPKTRRAPKKRWRRSMPKGARRWRCKERCQRGDHLHPALRCRHPFLWQGRHPRQQRQASSSASRNSSTAAKRTTTASSTSTSKAPSSAAARPPSACTRAAASSTYLPATTAMMLPTYSLYCATKGAVEQITRVLAKELGPKKIRVNVVSPGPGGDGALHGREVSGGPSPCQRHSPLSTASASRRRSRKSWPSWRAMHRTGSRDRT